MTYCRVIVIPRIASYLMPLNFHARLNVSTVFVRFEIKSGDIILPFILDTFHWLKWHFDSFTVFEQWHTKGQACPVVPLCNVCKIWSINKPQRNVSRCHKLILTRFAGQEKDNSYFLNCASSQDGFDVWWGWHSVSTDLSIITRKQNLIFVWSRHFRRILGLQLY